VLFGGQNQSGTGNSTYYFGGIWMLTTFGDGFHLAGPLFVPDVGRTSHRQP